MFFRFRKERRIRDDRESGCVRFFGHVCCTGVLFPDYQKRKVGSVTAVDISPGMAEIAERKSRGTQIQVVCGDVETLTFPSLFDCCMVYNAFPHFPDPQRLIQVLAGHLRPEGRLSIAHGMSRDKINEHHSGAAHRSSWD